MPRKKKKPRRTLAERRVKNREKMEKQNRKTFSNAMIVNEVLMEEKGLHIEFDAEIIPEGVGNH